MADEKKQETEKPVKVKGDSQLPMVGIIGFAIVLVALIVNLWFLLGIKSQVSTISDVFVSGKAITHEAKNGEKSAENKTDGDNPEDNSNKDTQYFETGRITTNPRASTSFVVINLGMIFKVNAVAEGEKKAEGESKEKETTAPPISPFGKRFDGMLRNEINSELGRLTVDEMQIPRDSLSNMLKTKLLPLFKNEKSFLKEVVIVEFIIQQ
jgi:hypothetical protein